MKHIYSFPSSIAFFALMLFFCLPVLGQGTYTQVYDLLQARCASCHSGGQPAGNLNLSGSQGDVYNALVEQTPSNAHAAQKGYKLIDKGHPYRSFLLRKINNGLLHPADGALDPQEGTTMPQNAPALSNIEVELVRQWIYAGSPQTGSPVNMNLITSYYTEGGYPMMPRPEAPAPERGFQIHLGPLFLQPASEIEYDIKYDLELPNDIEVKRLNCFINEESHHFLLYKYQNEPTGVADGLREINLVSLIFNLDRPLVDAWQDNGDHPLPAGTAYKWNANTTLDLNYHLPNFGSSILPADMYLNVYTQPVGTSIREMKTDLVYYDEGLLNLFSLVVLPNQDNQVFDQDIPNGNQWNLWSLSSHTHKFGTDYDIYAYDQNGNLGDHLFEGTDQNGYYDWEHPPVVRYEPFYVLPAGRNLHHRAVFNNTSDNLVTFGLTTNDEMFLTFLQYYEGETIPFVGTPLLQEKYCRESAPLSFVPEGGTLQGPGTQNNQFIPSMAGVGTHTITYTYNYNGQDLVAEYDVVVVAPEAPTIAYENNLLTAPLIYDTYQWYFNNEPIDGATGVLYQPTASGIYSLETTLYGCTTQSQPLNVVISGIDHNIEQTVLFSAMPNPFQNEVLLSYHLTEKSSVRIDVFNMLGQNVATLVNGEQNVGKHTHPFNAQTGAGKGVFFARITINGKTFTQKIVGQ